MVMSLIRAKQCWPWGQPHSQRPQRPKIILRKADVGGAPLHQIAQEAVLLAEAILATSTFRRQILNSSEEQRILRALKEVLTIVRNARKIHWAAVAGWDSVRAPSPNCEKRRAPRCTPGTCAGPSLRDRSVLCDVSIESEQMFDLRLLKKIDWLVVVVMVLLIAAGVTVIFSASSRGIALKQVLWASIGLVLFASVACFPYKKIALFAYPFYAAMLVALGLVLVAGQIRHGGKRWIEIAGLTFQPSEFAKLATVFALAKFLAQSRLPRKSWAYIFVPIAFIIPPMALIYLQPNLGTALAMLPVALGMLYLAGASVKKIAVLIAIGCLTLPPLWLEMKTYQKKRVLEFLPPGQRKFMLRFMTAKEKEELRRRLDPSGKQDLATLLSTMAEGWNSEQAMIAVGSGGIFGNGWRGGHQTRLGFLPEAHTDFVFPVFCEQWGFAGSITIIVLYWLLIWSGFRISGEAADRFGKLVASGITILIAWHVAVNTMMSLGLLPITGLPLPLMSYGGSSILTTMLALGVLEAIHARKFYPLSWRYSL